jgi:uncharacterized membrane protein
MTLILLLVLFIAIVWLAARVSDVANELKRLRGEVDALKATRLAPDAVPQVAPPAVATAPGPQPESIPLRDAEAGGQATSWPKLEIRPQPEAPAPTESLESRIGGRWLLYIGMATILVGASYFVKLAFDNEWITPLMRVALGLLAGLLLVVAGPVFRRRGYALYGQILTGGGIAILYISVFAAFNYYALIGATLAFGLMIAITAGAALLADREQSQALALMAVGGGFLTPFLVSSGRDAQVALFTYDAILVAGTAALARRRNWPALNAVSFALTVATVAVWADAYYQADRWLTTYGFLTVYVAMFIYIRHESGRWGTMAATAVSHLLILAPVLYHVFALALLFDHGGALLTYLVVATATGVSLNARGSAAPVRLVLWFAIMLPFLAWAGMHREWDAWLMCTVAVALYAMHGAAQAIVVSREGRLGRFDVGLVYVAAVGLYLGFEVALEHRAVVLLPLVALAIAGWHAALAAWLRERAPGIWRHMAVLSAAFAAVAVARQFDGPAKPVGWAVIACGLLWLGRRETISALRIAGSTLLFVAIAQLSALLGAPAATSHLPVANPRALATLFVLALMFALARAYAAPHAPPLTRYLRAAILLSAHLLALVLVTSEINAFWNVRSAGGRDVFAREVMLSLSWAAYAVGLIVAGIRRRYAPIRYLAMVVLAVTILKVFTADLAELGQAYRVLSAIGLGVLLLIASFLYQRFKPGEA